MKATVKIPKDATHRHHITIPIEVWTSLELEEGDILEIDFTKFEKKEPKK